MIKLLIVVVIVLVIVGIYAFGIARRMIYHPRPEMHSRPSDMGMEFEDAYFATSDGVEINGWFVPAEGAKLTILFCHGNGGNISYYLHTARFLHSLGMNCFLFDYRGYGKSKGKPSEKGTYRDVQAAWDWLIHNKGIDAGHIVILGRSLGGCIAAELATKTAPAGLWLESTFTSCYDMGALDFPRWLVYVFCDSQYPTEQFITKVKCPVLIVHSPDDDVVPYEFGRKLLEIAPEPKQFVQIAGGHNDGFYESGPLYSEPVTKWLRGLETQPAPVTAQGNSARQKVQSYQSKTLTSEPMPQTAKVRAS